LPNKKGADARPLAWGRFSSKH